MYIGALGYADDITLLSPSVRALNEMLMICHDFAEEFSISFNCNKTKCIKFGDPPSTLENVYLNDTQLEWVSEVNHLGHYINAELTDKSDCLKKRGHFIGSVNKLVGNYSHIGTNYMSHLFKNYCCSFYGSQLWDFSSNGFNDICTQWNKAVRRILYLNYKTHRWLLGPLIGQQHITTQFYNRFVRFIFKMFNCNNSIVSLVSQLALGDAMSPLGKNISFLKCTYSTDFTFDVKRCINGITNCRSLTEEQNSLINVLKEIQDSNVYIEGFDEHSKELFYDICVN